MGKGIKVLERQSFDSELSKTLPVVMSWFIYFA